MDKTGLIIKPGAFSRTELLNKLANLTENLLSEDLRKVTGYYEPTSRYMESEEIVAIANVYSTIADSVAKLPGGDGGLTITNCSFQGLSKGIEVQKNDIEQFADDEERRPYEGLNECSDDELNTDVAGNTDVKSSSDTI